MLIRKTKILNPTLTYTLFLTPVTNLNSNFNLSTLTLTLTKTSQGDHTLQAGAANQPVMTPEEHGCEPGSQNLGSGTSTRHLKYLAPPPQTFVKKRATEYCRNLR